MSLPETDETPVTTIDFRLRAARTQDIEPIYALLSPFAEQGVVLPRSRDSIQNEVDEFVVAVEQESGQITGCASLYGFDSGLCEIRSLAVSPEYGGQGIGSALIQTLVEQAQREGAERIFALTLRPGVFERQGFQQVSMDKLPEKVWKDCSYCKKRDHCDEIAVLRWLQDEG